MKASEIRSRFIGYFERHDHLPMPSSSLVPEDDPTLLFTNAGMVPFKRAFLGEEKRPAARAVTSQKCLRVSGKHNDLEEVGRTARHHTFFEMLGNFSFGDYFKREAIAYAWEFVTDELGMDPERLWATVHYSDDEALRLWTEVTGIPPERVKRLGDRHNFWQMGDTGPCGPCSEIHYDLRPAGSSMDLTNDQFLALGEADQFMEIWNLVFMQFDRIGPGDDQPLPAPSIDTGAGLERIAAIMQGRRTNYHTDLFLPIIQAAEAIIGREYSLEPDRWEEGLPFRVLADHARAVAFMLADGVFPSNEGRGYVLRRILRRAGRYAWLLGRREPTLEPLVGVVAEVMGDSYPELAVRRGHLLKTTRAEEERFLATIDAGMNRFEEIAPAGSQGTISGEEAFRLYDTFGFPVDLTQLMASERGYGVDVAEFEKALDVQRRRSRDARAQGGGAGAESGGLTGEILQAARGLEAAAAQSWIGYDELDIESDVIGWKDLGHAQALLLERNPFYAEAGGQVSDHGIVRGDGWEIEVETVVRNDAGQTVIVGELVEGALDTEPARVRASVDASDRRDTQRNHTATHLLHAALRSMLGEHVHQAGSLVAPDRLRFDFSHHGPVAPEELAAIERVVNEAVWANIPLDINVRSYRDALDAGAMALFGEKYGDEVRVVSIPGVSLELCGGCHVRSTGEIGSFQIAAESGVAAGIRRIEAVTGPQAYARDLERQTLLSGMASKLRTSSDGIQRRVEALIEERDRLNATLNERRGAESADLARDVVRGGLDLPGPGGKLITGAIELPEGSDLRSFGDVLRGELGSGAALLHVQIAGEDREAFLGIVTDDWIQRGLKAGDLVRIASRATGSGGGGKGHMAQGGIGDASRIGEALSEVEAHSLELAGSLGN
jgi:alanyl-tRNA synthetase